MLIVGLALTGDYRVADWQGQKWLTLRALLIVCRADIRREIDLNMRAGPA